MHLGAALFFYPRPLISRARRRWRPRRVRPRAVRAAAGSSRAGSAGSSRSGWVRRSRVERHVALLSGSWAPRRNQSSSLPFVNDQAARCESSATTHPITEISLGEVGDPLPVRHLGGEVTIDQVRRPICLPAAGDRSTIPAPTSHTGQALVAHQPIHRVLADLVALVAQVHGHLAAPVQPLRGADGAEQCIRDMRVGDGPFRRRSGFPVPVRAWGDLDGPLPPNRSGPCPSCSG